MAEYARTVSLQDSTGRYLCAEGGGGREVTWSRDAVGPWETFRQVDLDDGSVVYVTGSGALLRADYDSNRLTATGGMLMESVRFRVVTAGHSGEMALVTSRGTYVTSDQGDMPHVRVDAHAIGAWEIFRAVDHRRGHPPDRRVSSVSGAPASAEAMRSLAGPIRADGRCIRDDNGPWPALGISLFWAPWAYQHDRSRLDRAIHWAVGAGCTYARVFASIDWSQHGHTAPVDYMDAASVTGAIDYLAERGLRTHLTLISRRDIVRHEIGLVDGMAEWASTRGRDRLMLVEMANEASHPGNRNDVREMARLCKRFAERSNVLCCPSAPHGPSTEERDPNDPGRPHLESAVNALYAGSGARCTTIHWHRRHNTSERWWRPVRQPRQIAHGLPRHAPFPCINSEPFNFYDPKYESGNPGVAATVAGHATALICGHGATTHHDRPGVWTDVHYDEQPRATELQAALRCVAEHMPADIANWRRFRAGEDGHPFPSVLPQHWSFIGHAGYQHENEASGHGVSRAFAATSGDRFVMVLAGVRKWVTLRDDRSYDVYDLTDGEHVIRQRVGMESETTIGQDESDGEGAFLVVSA